MRVPPFGTNNVLTFFRDAAQKVSVMKENRWSVSFVALLRLLMFMTLALWAQTAVSK